MDNDCLFWFYTWCFTFKFPNCIYNLQTIIVKRIRGCVTFLIILFVYRNHKWNHDIVEFEAYLNISFFSIIRKAYSEYQKNTHTLFFNLRFFPVYLRNRLSHKNLFSSFYISFWRALSWNKHFSNPMTQSADISKNVNFPIKSLLLGKIRHFEDNLKFFSYLKSRNII